jgi:hypothetical protein
LNWLLPFRASALSIASVFLCCFGGRFDFCLPEEQNHISTVFLALSNYAKTSGEKRHLALLSGFIILQHLKTETLHLNPSVQTGGVYFDRSLGNEFIKTD